MAIANPGQILAVSKPVEPLERFRQRRTKEALAFPFVTSFPRVLEARRMRKHVQVLFQVLHVKVKGIKPNTARHKA